MFSFFKSKENKETAEQSEFLFKIYNDVSSFLSDERQRKDEIEQQLFRDASKDPNVISIFPSGTDIENEIKRIYIALIMAGAGQKVKKGWVPLLAIKNSNCIKYLHGKYDEFDENASAQPENVLNASWRVLRYFKDNEALPK